MQFTSLERDILRWFAENNRDGALAQQCDTVVLKQREYTGVGFFLTLEVPKSLPRCTSPLIEPHIESGELEHGAGAILFVKDGYLELLEIYSYAGPIPQELNQYRLLNSPSPPN
jgi:hypothetical protein